MSVIAAAAADFQAPEIDWGALAPMIAVLGAGVLGVVLEALLPRRLRNTAQVVLALAALVASLVLLSVLWAKPPVSVGTVGPAGAVGRLTQGMNLSIMVDRPALFLQSSIVVLALLAVLTMVERSRDADPFTPQGSAVPGSEFENASRQAGLVQTEVLPLLLFAVGGMMVFTAAGDLLTMFVALELLSLPLYILCGLARRRRLLSQEASLKYFLLGSFGSAMFLFGAALLYGATGSVNLAAMSQVFQPGAPLLVATGVVLVLAGLLFKIGAVPFHAWTPDVYTGAPTPVTGFMAACTKVAAFGALVRVLFYGLAPLQDTWQPVLVIVAVATMVVGSVVAIVQADIKRMLAYSSIAHAGFILTALVAVQEAGISSTLFYVLAYGFTTLGAFAVVALVRERDARNNITGEATHLSQWAGLGRRSPVLAGVFTLFLFAMAGIPLTSGFTAKFAVFSAAVSAGYAWLAVIGVIASAAAAFFYVRVIVLMYFSEPAADATTVVAGRPFTAAAVALGAVATILLGVVPAPVLDLAHTAATAPFGG
ncbi:MAG TPA: NADH-quinone oxidoreductase subunit NuoN [Actinomycetales bacterium]|nr:NADH-quinone oxidoreductase subunit NuoN [Actinomycetales bacterium]